MSCALCRLARTACDRNLPCERCVRLNMAHRCFFPPPSKRGRPSRRSASASSTHAGEQPPVVKILPHLPPTEASVPPPTLLSGDVSPPAIQPPQAQQLPLPAPVVTKEESPGQGSCGATTAFLVDTIRTLKEDVRAMAEKMCGMKRKVREAKHLKDDVCELQRRVRQLEVDNSQLRIQLAHIAAASSTLATSSPSPPPSSSSLLSPSASSSSWASAGSFKRTRVDSDEDGEAPCSHATHSSSSSSTKPDAGLSGEMLWCFPFLQHFDFSSRRFVVDDIHKAIVVFQIQQGRRSAVFANLQFCTVSGFSMDELFNRELLWVVPRHEKLKFVRAWRIGAQVGMSEIIHCCPQLEHKGGNLVKIMARCQFFFTADGQILYSAVSIDQVLGMDYMPYSLDEARLREAMEWTEVSQAGRIPSLAPRPAPLTADGDQQPPQQHAATLPSPPPYEAQPGPYPPPDTPAAGWHEFLQLENDLTSATFAFSPSPHLDSS